MQDRDRLIDDDQLTVCLFMYPPSISLSPMDTLRGTYGYALYKLRVVGGHYNTIIMYVNLWRGRLRTNYAMLEWNEKWNGFNCPPSAKEEATALALWCAAVL